VRRHQKHTSHRANDCLGQSHGFSSFSPPR
jgi:hypothetical protein